MCLQCHLRLGGTVQSAILFHRVTLPVWHSPSADRPPVSEGHWEVYGWRPALCVSARRREVFLVRSICVRPSTHTQDCVQLVCDQHAVCQHYGRLCDCSKLYHRADSHVGFCHLQGDANWHVQVSWIHLTSKRNNALINKLKLQFTESWIFVVW
jgi:hypothetical protein